jgi:lipid-A-disaccharide synthase-like uncharacterized protein
MNINAIWIVCILVRISIIFAAIYISEFELNELKIIGSVILCIIGLGFIFKYITGSNNERQISKVFWHKTRIIHGLLYILASYFLYSENSVIVGVLLGSDVVFSILYRLITNQ